MSRIYKMKHVVYAVYILGLFLSSAAAQILINGAGATFPEQIYQKWFSEYQKIDPTVSFNYQGIGSGGGQKQILAETVDFGASDGPMSDQNIARAPRELWHIPTIAGAVVISYNLPNSPVINIDGQTLALIYLGSISKWNDPLIVNQNLGIQIPDIDIVVVHRSDGSGSSFIFSDFLSSVSSEWKNKVGKNTSVNGPVGLGGKGNAGVASQIKQSPGAIGYIELAYAHQNKLAVANIKNSSGIYITPSVQSVSEALKSVSIPDDFRFSMVNPAGSKAYPISGISWLLVYSQQKDAAKGKKLIEFLTWAFANGESYAASLDYVALPDSLIKRAMLRVNAIKY